MGNVDVQAKVKYRGALLALVAVVLGVCAGCHDKPAPVATAADVAVAQQEAQHEIAQAQLEAKKDVKSVAKISGGNPKDVARARANGNFDIAMAHADGDHKVALEKCLTLPPEARQPCREQAEGDYQSTVNKAKAIRDSRR